MFWKLFYPRPMVLITSSHGERTNVTAVEWSMPVSRKPPVIAVVLTNNGLSFDLITRSKEFVVAIPDEKVRQAVEICASTSGKFVDKFSESKFTALKANNVSAPLIMEACANFECKVLSYVNYAMDHTVVFGEIVQMHMPSELEKKGAKFEGLLAFEPYVREVPSEEKKKKMA